MVFRLRPATVVVTLAFATVATQVVVAQAVSIDASSLNLRLQAIEKRLGAAEARNVSTGAGYAVGAASNPAANAYGMADLDRRMEELEQENSQQSGSIERIQFAIEKVAQRLDDVTRDLDMRLNELEARAARLEAGRMVAPPAAALVGAGSPTTVAPVVAKPSVSVSIPATMAPADHFSKAYAFLTAADYPTAQAWLEEFVKRYPKDKQADDAYYWLGETRLVQNNYPAAVQAFRDGLRAFPQGAKAPANLLKMGMALEQMGQKDFAKASWTKLLKDYPKSNEAGIAKTRLAGIKG